LTAASTSRESNGNRPKRKENKKTKEGIKEKEANVRTKAGSYREDVWVGIMYAKKKVIRRRGWREAVG